MSDFNEIYTNITNVNVAANAGIAFSKLAALPSAQILVGSAGNVATAVTMSGDATISNTGVVTVAGGGIVPIGTILPFYDYNNTLTFDNTKYAYCDGSIVNFTGIGPQTTPDLSGRYLIGFGTVGGGNIDTDPWATPAVGNAGWTINIQHSHTVNNHTHDLSNHHHSIGSDGLHNHASGTYVAEAEFCNTATGEGGEAGVYINQVSNGNNWNSNYFWDLTSASADLNAVVSNRSLALNVEGDSANNGTHDHSGVTGAPSTNISGGATPGTDNQLSAVQDIRPSSIRVRYIIRYA